VLTDDILNKIANVFENLVVNEEKMRQNVDSANGFIMAESVLLTLSAKGMGRQDAHELIRQIAIQAEETDMDFRNALSENKEVMTLLSASELDEVMDPDNYLGKAPEMTDRVVARAEKVLGTKIA